MGDDKMIKGKNRVLIFLSWIHDLLLFEGVYVLASGIRDIKGQELKTFLLQGLFMLLPILLSYALIGRCRNLWLFLIFSLAAVCGMYILSKSLLTGRLTAFIFLFRCYVRLKQGEIRRKMRELPKEAGTNEDEAQWELPALLDSPKTVHLLLFAGIYLGLLYFHRDVLLRIMFGILAAELCVLLAYRYLEALHGFIKNNLHVANLPSGTMKKIGTGILVSGMAVLIIFMLPAVIYHKEPLSGLRFKAENSASEIMEYKEEHTEPDYMMDELMTLKAQAKEAPAWLKRISEIISVLMIAVISYLILKLILTAVRKAMEAFSDDGDDEIIFLSKEEDGKRISKHLIKRDKKEGFRSPDRRIRRLYKGLIRRSLKGLPRGNETPSQLEMKSGLHGSGEMHRIHELYEKARYGNEKCTKEEAAEVRLLINRR